MDFSQTQILDKGNCSGCTTHIPKQDDSSDQEVLCEIRETVSLGEAVIAYFSYV